MVGRQKESLLTMISLQIQQILENSLYLSAGELPFYIKQFTINIDLLYHHTAQYFSKDEDLIKVCLNASTFYKSFVLNKLLVERKKIYLSDLATDHVIKIKQLKEVYQLAALQPDALDKKLVQLRDMIHDEEKSLNTVSMSMENSYSSFDPKRYLAKQESLVDFIYYHYGDQPDSIQYAAIVYNASLEQYSMTTLLRLRNLRSSFFKTLP
ncbi:MAG: hypothetical protein IPG87_15935 [Saprospiraceae bacterium]|nr:hypothetical protein [Candidatus Vicinibacter affinis]